VAPAGHAYIADGHTDLPAMREALQSDYRTTITEFRAFIEDRPDDEKWELIDGEIVLDPTANNRHQIIVRNVLFELEALRRQSGVSWQAIPGISTRHPQDENNEPIPDVMIVPPSGDIFNWTFDVQVVFEILSPFSRRRDMVHKRAFYTRIDSLMQYVVLAQDRREATVFARSAGFAPLVLNAANEKLEIEPLGVSIPLADIYRDVPLG
jgi:Uma2 family endonuclease